MLCDLSLTSLVGASGAFFRKVILEFPTYSQQWRILIWNSEDMGEFKADSRTQKIWESWEIPSEFNTRRRAYYHAVQPKRILKSSSNSRSKFLADSSQLQIQKVQCEFWAAQALGVLNIHRVSLYFFVWLSLLFFSWLIMLRIIFVSLTSICHLFTSYSDVTHQLSHAITHPYIFADWTFLFLLIILDSFTCINTSLPS